MITQETIDQVVELIDQIGMDPEIIVKWLLDDLEMTPGDESVRLSLVVILLGEILAQPVAELTGQWVNGKLAGGDAGWDLEKKSLAEKICRLLEVEFPKITFKVQLIWD